MKKLDKRFLLFLAIFFCVGLGLNLVGKVMGGERQIREVIYSNVANVDHLVGTGDYGQVYVGSEGIHIGGKNGVHVSQAGIMIGGEHGVYVGPGGISIGGLGLGGNGVAQVTAIEGEAFQSGDKTGLYSDGSEVGYFTGLDVDIDLGDVYLVCGDTYGVDVSYKAGQNYRLLWEMDGDNLKVWSESDWGFHGADSPEATVVVTVRSGAALKNINLSTNLGDVVTEVDGVRCVEANLSSDLGDVYCSGLTAQELEAGSDLGDVNVIFPQWEGVSYDASADLGNLDVASSHWSGKGSTSYTATPQKYFVKVHSSLGDVSLYLEEKG